MSKSEESLNRINKKNIYMSNFEKFVAVLFFICGAIILLSALPQQTPSIWDLKFIKINIGTSLDLIRIILGGITIYIGKKIWDEA